MNRLAIREIVENDLEFLTKKSRPVTEFDQKLKTLVDDMKETLIKSGGVGLAAVQVGVLRRLFIVDIDMDGKNIKEFINPEIIKKKGKNDNYIEGCLSFPGRGFRIVRPQVVRIRAKDVNGNAFEYEAEDFVARALMHESEHLDGIVLPSHAVEVFDE